MEIKRFHRPVFWTLIGAMFGGGFLIAVIYTAVDESPSSMIEFVGSSRAAWEVLLFPAIVGGMYGGLVGLALWTATDRHRVPNICRAMSGGILFGGCLSLLISGLFFADEAAHGSTGIMGPWEEGVYFPDTKLTFVYMDLVTLQINVIIGVVCGAFVGLAAWITFTKRSIHPLFTAFAGAILAVLLATVAFSVYWAFDSPKGNGGGLGGTMYAVGMGNLYFLRILPGSALIGLIGGSLWGVHRRSGRITA